MVLNLISGQATPAGNHEYSPRPRGRLKAMVLPPDPDDYPPIDPDEPVPDDPGELDIPEALPPAPIEPMGPDDPGGVPEPA